MRIGDSPASVRATVSVARACDALRHLVVEQWLVLAHFILPSVAAVACLT